MFKLLLKKIFRKIPLENASSYLLNFFQKHIAEKYLEKIQISKENAEHLQNLSIVALSYTLSSFIVYPEIRFSVFLKEIFALLCTYGAIFLWFMEKTNLSTRYKTIIGVTSCATPAIFINNAFSVALVEILLMIVLEFIILKYIDGCQLFSKLIPVYLVCETTYPPEIILELKKKYKILEFINIVDNAKKELALNSMISVDDIRKRLSKLNQISFCPFPNRILYFAERINTDTIIELSNLSAEFSIPLFKLEINIDNKKNVSQRLSDKINMTPLNIKDFEKINISQQEKTSLNSAFKSKKIWMFYDGRQAVLDLISAISTISSADITIFCESEQRLHEVDTELKYNNSNKNCKIKITDINLLELQETTPDILFYNIPIKSISSSENNLKEAVVKNILDTERIIEFAQNSKIKFVFLLSSIEALNARNWIGATQRLGELAMQSADSKLRRLHPKFRVIRLPECATDKNGILGEIISSIISNGFIDFNFSQNEPLKFYYRKDIFHLLIKTIVSSLKEHSFASSVYTLVPTTQAHIDNMIKIICNVFCVKKDDDIRITYKNDLETMNLEDFPNISESLEETEFEGVFATKLLNSVSESFESPWDFEKIKTMKTRDLIASVFQTLSEKTKKNV